MVFVQTQEEEEEPLATSPSRPVAEVESEDSQPQEKKTPGGSSKRAGKTVKAEPKLETGDSESQEEKMTPSPSPRRGGRRGGRGGRAGGSWSRAGPRVPPQHQECGATRLSRDGKRICKRRGAGHRC